MGESVVEQVKENIYRLGVTLPQNPLSELNSYLIRGGERDLLIDTGFRRPQYKPDRCASHAPPLRSHRACQGGGGPGRPDLYQ